MVDDLGSRGPHRYPLRTDLPSLLFPASRRPASEAHMAPHIQPLRIAELLITGLHERSKTAEILLHNELDILRIVVVDDECVPNG
jgi:hypothetical protein